MPFPLKIDFKAFAQAAKAANSANFGAGISPIRADFSNFSNFSRGADTQKYAREGDRAARAALDDAAWRDRLDACPGYPGGCFSCREAILDNAYFCRAANRTVFGADVVEVEILKDEGADVPRGGGVKLDLDLAGVQPWRDRGRRA